MKQAILTKYLGPTNTKGARVKAWCNGGMIYMAWDHALSSERNHRRAVGWLTRKMNWTHTTGAPFENWQGGALPDGTGYCFVQVEREES